MDEKLTFIHAADLHIGAPIRGLRGLSDEWERRLIDAIPAAWERVVETAISRLSLIHISEPTRPY